jgi:hypothetical protein
MYLGASSLHWCHAGAFVRTRISSQDMTSSSIYYSSISLVPSFLVRHKLTTHMLALSSGPPCDSGEFWSAMQHHVHPKILLPSYSHSFWQYAGAMQLVSRALVRFLPVTRMVAWRASPSRACHTPSSSTSFLKTGLMPRRYVLTNKMLPVSSSSAVACSSCCCTTENQCTSGSLLSHLLYCDCSHEHTIGDEKSQRLKEMSCF